MIDKNLIFSLRENDSKMTNRYPWANGTLSNKWSGLGEWVMGDTPQTVKTTRAPALLKSIKAKTFYR